MKKSQKILIGVGAGILVLGVAGALVGPIIYRDFIAAPAAEAPSLSADKDTLEVPSGSADGTPIDADSLTGEWTVSDGSEAGYRVDEVLNGTDVTVTGRTDQVTGTFSIGESGLSLDAAKLTVDVASIATDNPSRDAYFRDQALRTDEFPTAEFVLTKPVTLTAAPALGEVVKATATGDLTIAGVTKSVTAEVEVRGVAGDGAQDTASSAEIAGSIPITFTDFGVTAPSLGFVKVEDAGSVEFQLVAEPK